MPCISVAGRSRRPPRQDLSSRPVVAYPGGMQRHGIQAWWPS